MASRSASAADLDVAVHVTASTASSMPSRESVLAAAGIQPELGSNGNGASQHQARITTSAVDGQPLGDVSASRAYVDLGSKPGGGAGSDRALHLQTGGHVFIGRADGAVLAWFMVRKLRTLLHCESLLGWHAGGPVNTLEYAPFIDHSKQAAPGGLLFSGAEDGDILVLVPMAAAAADGVFVPQAGLPPQLDLFTVSQARREQTSTPHALSSDMPVAAQYPALLQRLSRHRGPVTAVRYSSSLLLFSAGNDGQLIVWAHGIGGLHKPPNTGVAHAAELSLHWAPFHAVQALELPGRGWATCMATLASGNGTRVYVGDSAGSVHVWQHVPGKHASSAAVLAMPNGPAQDAAEGLPPAAAILQDVPAARRASTLYTASMPALRTDLASMFGFLRHAATWRAMHGARVVGMLRIRSLGMLISWGADFSARITDALSGAAVAALRHPHASDALGTTLSHTKAEAKIALRAASASSSSAQYQPDAAAVLASDSNLHRIRAAELHAMTRTAVHGSAAVRARVESSGYAASAAATAGRPAALAKTPSVTTLRSRLHPRHSTTGLHVSASSQSLVPSLQQFLPARAAGATGMHHQRGMHRNVAPRMAATVAAAGWHAKRVRSGTAARSEANAHGLHASMSLPLLRVRRWHAAGPTGSPGSSGTPGGSPASLSPRPLAGSDESEPDEDAAAQVFQEALEAAAAEGHSSTVGRVPMKRDPRYTQFTAAAWQDEQQLLVMTDVLGRLFVFRPFASERCMFELALVPPLRPSGASDMPPLEHADKQAMATLREFARQNLEQHRAAKCGRVLSQAQASPLHAGRAQQKWEGSSDGSASESSVDLDGPSVTVEDVARQVRATKKLRKAAAARSPAHSALPQQPGDGPAAARAPADGPAAPGPTQPSWSQSRTLLARLAPITSLHIVPGHVYLAPQGMLLPRSQSLDIFENDGLGQALHATDEQAGTPRSEVASNAAAPRTRLRTASSSAMAKPSSSAGAAVAPNLSVQPVYLMCTIGSMAVQMTLQPSTRLQRVDKHAEPLVAVLGAQLLPPAGEPAGRPAAPGSGAHHMSELMALSVDSGGVLDVWDVYDHSSLVRVHCKEAASAASEKAAQEHSQAAEARDTAAALTSQDIVSDLVGEGSAARQRGPAKAAVSTANTHSIAAVAAQQMSASKRAAASAGTVRVQERPGETTIGSAEAIAELQDQLAQAGSGVSPAARRSSRTSRAASSPAQAPSSAGAVATAAAAGTATADGDPVLLCAGTHNLAALQAAAAAVASKHRVTTAVAIDKQPLAALGWSNGAISMWHLLERHATLVADGFHQHEIQQIQFSQRRGVPCMVTLDAAACVGVWELKYSPDVEADCVLLDHCASLLSRCHVPLSDWRPIADQPDCRSPGGQREAPAAEASRAAAKWQAAAKAAQPVGAVLLSTAALRATRRHAAVQHSTRTAPALERVRRLCALQAALAEAAQEEEAQRTGADAMVDAVARAGRLTLPAYMPAWGRVSCICSVVNQFGQSQASMVLLALEGHGAPVLLLNMQTASLVAGTKLAAALPSEPAESEQASTLPGSMRHAQHLQAVQDSAGAFHLFACTASGDMLTCRWRLSSREDDISSCVLLRYTAAQRVQDCMAAIADVRDSATLPACPVACCMVSSTTAALAFCSGLVLLWSGVLCVDAGPARHVQAHVLEYAIVQGSDARADDGESRESPQAARDPLETMLLMPQRRAFAADEAKHGTLAVSRGEHKHMLHGVAAANVRTIADSAALAESQRVAAQAAAAERIDGSHRSTASYAAARPALAAAYAVLQHVQRVQASNAASNDRLMPTSTKGGQQQQQQQQQQLTGMQVAGHEIQPATAVSVHRYLAAQTACRSKLLYLAEPWLLEPLGAVDVIREHSLSQIRARRELAARRKAQRRHIGAGMGHAIAQLQLQAQMAHQQGTALSPEVARGIRRLQAVLPVVPQGMDATQVRLAAATAWVTREQAALATRVAAREEEAPTRTCVAPARIFAGIAGAARRPGEAQPFQQSSAQGDGAGWPVHGVARLGLPVHDVFVGAQFTSVQYLPAVHQLLLGDRAGKVWYYKLPEAAGQQPVAALAPAGSSGRLRKAAHVIAAGLRLQSQEAAIAAETPAAGGSFKLGTPQNADSSAGPNPRAPSTAAEPATSARRSRVLHAVQQAQAWLTDTDVSQSASPAQLRHLLLQAKNLNQTVGSRAML